MQKQFADIPDNEPVISLTHIYDAPLSLVWEAFTKPEHLRHWWGPDGFTIEHIDADIREGGFWKFVMVGPDGTRWDNYHQFYEFRPLERISHRHGSMKDDPDAFDSVITFRNRGETQTEVTMRMTLASMEARGDVLGFNADTLGLQTMAKAETYLNQVDMSL
jgi:uncharacterized protein YndB with AHSA1/START domain